MQEYRSMAENKNVCVCVCVYIYIQRYMGKDGKKERK
jgi:hypothetical protein